MEQLKTQHLRMLAHLDMSHKRSMMNIIDWNSRLIGIRGARGVGKTTMMLQHIKENYGTDTDAALYVSMDHLYFTRHSLLELAEEFYKRGGQRLYLDEVHKYEGWSREVKNIYDGFPLLKIVFTGSSLLNILNAEADLSRRCVSYDMPGLSFREYLYFAHNITIPVISLDDVLHISTDASHEVLRRCRPLQHFLDYMQYGYYPFFLQRDIDYMTQLQKVVNMILEVELPQLRNVDVANVRKLRSLLSVISSGVPFAVDISKMAQSSELNRNTILTYLAHLHRAGLLNLLYSDTQNIKRMQKPDKIYIDNPNMLYAWATNPVKIGTVRETFVVNQLAAKHKVEFMKKLGDFFVDSKYTIEVGGEDKDFSQVANVPDSYILADNIETAIGHKLPIWAIGFLY